MKVNAGRDLQYERFAVKSAVEVETNKLREVKGNGDVRAVRMAEKKVSQAKRKLRRAD